MPSYTHRVALGQLQNEADLQRWLQDQLSTIGLSQPDAGVQDKSIGKGKLATDALNAFLKLNTVADRKVEFGNGSVTFTASTTSSTATITHGLGSTPAFIFVAGRTSTSVWLGAFNPTSTTFQVLGTYASAISGAQNFDWLAVV